MTRKPKPSARMRQLASALLAAAVWVAPVRAQSRLVTTSLHARTLVGNAIGDASDRAITVYLPPSYDRDSTRRYPVAYLLHGATSDPKEWLDGTYQGLDLAAALDAQAGQAEYLVVMPAADNRFGGPFYVNSRAFGRWEDFVATELVQWVDTRFRTMPTRANRALVGQSMGGFGALSIARHYPQLFGHVYAMSPCCLGLVGDLGPEGALWRGPTRAYVRALSMAMAPAKTGGAAVDTTPPFPFRADANGHLQEDTLVSRAWRARLPLDQFSRDAHAYRRLCTIALDAGAQDALTNVVEGSAAFARALTAAGITHRYTVFTGGHVDRTRERFETAVLPFLAAAFRAPPSTCPS